jgi:Magnesium chelatase, subunit ChlI
VKDPPSPPDGRSRPSEHSSSLAHRGVLFLDEVNESRRDVLEGMRQFGSFVSAASSLPDAHARRGVPTTSCNRVKGDSWLSALCPGVVRIEASGGRWPCGLERLLGVGSLLLSCVSPVRHTVYLGLVANQALFRLSYIPALTWEVLMERIETRVPLEVGSAEGRSLRGCGTSDVEQAAVVASQRLRRPRRTVKLRRRPKPW